MGPANGNGGGGKGTLLSISALGSALCGGLCLGIFMFVNAAQAFFETSDAHLTKMNESQASMSKAVEKLAEASTRAEARASTRAEVSK